MYFFIAYEAVTEGSSNISDSAYLVVWIGLRSIPGRYERVPGISSPEKYAMCNQATDLNRCVRLSFLKESQQILTARFAVRFAYTSEPVKDGRPTSSRAVSLSVNVVPNTAVC